MTTQQPLHTLTARDVMTSSLLAAHESWTVAELAQFLVSNGITGAPVVDDEEQLVGVVSVTDVTRYASMDNEDYDARSRHVVYTDSLDFDSRLDYLEEYAEAHMEAATAGDIMTPSLFDVNADTPIAKVSKEMVSNGIHRVFVSDEGRIIGVISALDILKLLTE